MQLVNYQYRYFEELYSKLVNDNHQFILFSGKKGSGKSVILGELANRLIENWQVFFISGAGAESPPYYTWYSLSNAFANHKTVQINEISFGVDFQPISIPIGLGIGVGISQSESLLNNNEQAILKSILSKVGGNEHILFIADNYNSWDLASQIFLMKIIAGQKDILGIDVCAHFILVDQYIDSSTILMNHKLLEINIHELSLEDIREVISVQQSINSLEVYSLEEIIKFTGHDLRLINLAVSYQQENMEFSGIHSLEDLLERRILDISKTQSGVCKALERVSIIDSYFSEKEASYLLDKEPLHAERLLNEATNLKLIEKEHKYIFPSLEIHRYFKKKLDNEKKYLHYKFAQYLQEYYPEDYFSRANHLFLSENAYSQYNVSEAAYLLTLEIIRRKEITNGVYEPFLEEKLSEIINFLPPEINYMIRSNISLFMQGNNNVNSGNYSEAIISFTSLQLTYATKVFEIESMRLLVLSYVQLASNLYEIKKNANDLYDMLMNPELLEDEVWCRAALLLLEVYGDRHICSEKFQVLKKGFEMKIRKHMYQSSFRNLNAKYNSKAALFYNSVIATKLTQESCDYYRTYNSIQNLYFSLCNNAANRMICGEYEVASDRINECKDIMVNNSTIYFPSIYKIKNNDIINNFLKSEGILFDYNSKQDRKEIIIKSAQEAIKELEWITNQQGFEITHVIEFNYLSMLLLTDNRDIAYKIIQKLKKEYKDLDPYYQYYYQNACIAYYLLEGKYGEAVNHLNIIEEMIVPLLSGYTQILNRRRCILFELVEENFKGSGFDYNYEIVKRGIHTQDVSASFWGRGLLLSDLQYLSF